MTGRGQDKVCAIVPAKALREGKSRLGTVLSAGQRAALNERFLHHTLEIVCSLAEIDLVAVVSLDRTVRGIAAEHGAHWVAEEQPRGLNPALELAAGWAREAGAGQVLSVSTDLPLLSACDLRAVLATLGPHRRGVTIAPDERGEGTNVLLQAPPGIIRFSYGLGSFREHCRLAWENHLEPTVIRRPGLLLDIDSPDDLHQWEKGPRADAGQSGTPPSPSPRV